MDFFFEYVNGRYKNFIEERLRWQHLNDGISLLLRAKGYEKAPLYNDTIKQFDDQHAQEKDERTDEEITEDILKIFSKE